MSFLKRIDKITADYEQETRKNLRTSEQIIEGILHSHENLGLSSIDTISLHGAMDVLPVFEAPDGHLYINIPDVGTGMVYHNDPSGSVLATYWKCPPDLNFGGDHYHTDSEELVIVTEGSCYYPQEDMHLVAGDMRVVPKGVPHTFLTKEEGCHMYVIWTPALKLFIQKEDLRNEDESEFN